MKVAAIIVAREESRRVPRKNLAPVAGKPLLAHSIGHALAATTVTRTFVSTDDEEIAGVARAYGAEVVMRPVAVASDTATSESALLHVLDHLASTEDFVPDIVVFLQCTSPVRRPGDIDRAVEMVAGGAYDSVFSATESRGFIWRREDGVLKSVNYDYRQRHREQEHPEEFRENGSIFVFRPTVLRELNNRLGGRMGVYVMDYWTSFQVDSPEDVALADWILRDIPGLSEPVLRPPEPSLVVFDFDGVMTDNKVFVFEDGREAVACDRSDSLGLARLIDSATPVLVLSTETNRVVQTRCAKLCIPCVQSVGDKWAALQALLDERGIDPRSVVFVGNDVNDLECLEKVGWGVAVADAHHLVRAAARLVLSNPGGRGAVRELCDWLLGTGHGR